MKGTKKVIDILNKNLALELTAINQYMVNSEICGNWNYGKLEKVIKGRAIAEMKHAEKIIERILFLEGIPIVSKLGEIHIGSTVQKIHDNDWIAELEAVKNYNDGIKIALSEGDNGTKELFTENLKDEEEHIDWIESQQDQIKQMGIERYLSEQTD